MSIAAVYDIHGNLPALAAVLDEIRKQGVDQLVVGGDVLPGPMPQETLSCLLELDIPVHFLYGNGEVAVLQQLSGRDPVGVPEAHRPAIRWTAQQLSSDHHQLLRSWPATIRLAVAGLGPVLFCHATPRNENEIFTCRTAEDRLLPVFKGVEEALVICGHTHMQFHRSVGGIQVVNAGSVGMPFGEPGANWLLLGPGVELRHTAYDLGKAAEQIRNTSYPGAQNFADNNVLHPPSQASMLELFSRVELR